MLQEFLRSQKHIFSYLHFIDHHLKTDPKENYEQLQAIKNLALESIFLLINPNEYKYDGHRSDNNIIDQAINYIGANFDQRIYISQIALNACTSERNLQYAFKKSLFFYLKIINKAIKKG